MSEENQWYTNKELFEQINNMQQDFQGLRQEMRETRNVIKKYNGLREEMGAIKEKVDRMEAVKAGKSNVGKAIREWGGWIVGILGMIAAFGKLLI